MAIERRTIVDRVEILRDGTIQVRMVKGFADGDTFTPVEYHRTVIAPGTDAEAQIADVNAHLGDLGEAAPVFRGVGQGKIVRHLSLWWVKDQVNVGTIR